MREFKLLESCRAEHAFLVCTDTPLHAIPRIPITHCTVLHCTYLFQLCPGCKCANVPAEGARTTEFSVLDGTADELIKLPANGGQSHVLGL